MICVEKRNFRHGQQDLYMKARMYELYNDCSHNGANGLIMVLSANGLIMVLSAHDCLSAGVICMGETYEKHLASCSTTTLAADKGHFCHDLTCQ